jgi:hypothetical protein
VKKPHGIPPRKAYVRIRMTLRERRALLVMLASVDREDELADCADLRAFDNISWRLRQAKVHLPMPRRSA